MENKTQKLILTLEYLALVVSCLLVLIDYKLKRDLLQMIMRIEREIYARQADTVADDSHSTTADNLSTGNLVADVAGMEATNGDHAPGAAGQPEPGPGPGHAPVKRAGTRNKTVPQPDKQVGP